jgi:very-short-patch-repair endonuclease
LSIIQVLGNRRRKRTAIAPEEVLALQIWDEKLPVPVREHRFHPERRWRFDFAWPDLKLAVECEGGTWIAGRHTRGSGFAADCEKYNAAAMGGWKVLRFPSNLIHDGTAINALKAAHITARET